MVAVMATSRVALKAVKRVVRTALLWVVMRVVR